MESSGGGFEIGVFRNTDGKALARKADMVCMNCEGGTRTGGPCWRGETCDWSEWLGRRVIEAFRSDNDAPSN